MITNGLTETEELMLVALLKKVGQPWSEKFYNTISSMFRLLTTDLVIMCGGRVFLTQRPQDDEFDAGRWHFPGTLIRATDKSISDSLLRIAKKELYLSDENSLVAKIRKADYIGETFSNAVRGPEVNQYFCVCINVEEAELLLEVGRFVNKDEFRGLDVLQHHIDIDIWSKIF